MSITFQCVLLPTRATKYFLILLGKINAIFQTKICSNLANIYISHHGSSITIDIILLNFLNCNSGSQYLKAK